MAARSMKASEVWTFNWYSLLKRRFLTSHANVRSTIRSQAHHLEGALPAFGDVQSPPVTPFWLARQLAALVAAIGHHRPDPRQARLQACKHGAREN